MAVEFIFWDNDGVLVDTEGLYYEASREALALIGFDLTVEQFATISLASGRSVFELATDDHATMDTLRTWRNHRYSELLCEKDLVIPGVREILAELAPHFGMAIVTSSRRDHFDLIHQSTNLLPFFDFVLCREDYHEAKPHPEPYQLALRQCGRDSSQCLVIEDSTRGLAAAKSAGLTCWVVPSPQTRGQDFSSADRVLSCLGDMRLLLGDTNHELHHLKNFLQ